MLQQDYNGLDKLMQQLASQHRGDTNTGAMCSCDW